MKLKGFAAALLAAIFYGTNPLGTLQLYADGMNPSSVLVYRYAFATLMFLIWMAAKRESLTIKWGTAIRLAILGTLMSMSSATLYLSFRYMDAGVASTILFSYPIMVADMEHNAVHPDGRQRHCPTLPRQGWRDAQHRRRVARHPLLTALRLLHHRRQPNPHKAVACEVHLLDRFLRPHRPARLHLIYR